MSWSVQFIGSPEKVAAALTAQVEHMGGGQSQKEYEAALPHLVGLVNQNFGEPGTWIKLEARGHGYAVDGEMKQSNCVASIEHLYGVLV